MIKLLALCIAVDSRADKHFIVATSAVWKSIPFSFDNEAPRVIEQLVRTCIHNRSYGWFLISSEFNVEKKACRRNAFLRIYAEGVLVVFLFFQQISYYKISHFVIRWEWIVVERQSVDDERTSIKLYTQILRLSSVLGSAQTGACSWSSLFPKTVSLTAGNIDIFFGLRYRQTRTENDYSWITNQHPKGGSGFKLAASRVLLRNAVYLVDFLSSFLSVSLIPKHFFIWLINYLAVWGYRLIISFQKQRITCQVVGVLEFLQEDFIMRNQF